MYKLGLIGYPLSHSMSKVIQEAALKSAGLEGSYEILETQQEDLITRVKYLRANGFQGFNVTIPLKVPITLFLSSVDDIANVAGSANTIKILKVSEKSYLIYEGSPSDSQGITKAVGAFTKYNPKDYGTAYGEAIKKAFDHCLTMKKEGYVPSVVVIGDLENEGAIEKQINWDTLPKNVQSVKEYIPEISMMFVFAHPEKLDLVKTKLNPVLGEKKLIVANEQNAQKALSNHSEALFPKFYL